MNTPREYIIEFIEKGEITLTWDKTDYILMMLDRLRIEYSYDLRGEEIFLTLISVPESAIKILHRKG